MSTVASSRFRSFLRRPSAVFRLAALLGLVLGGAGACGDGGSAPKGPDLGSPALAIVDSDYTQASISLYQPASGRLVDACTSSAASGPTMAQALSGDVLLPSGGAQGGELILIDSKSSVLTFMNPSTCVARAQLSVSTGGFKGFPQDVLRISSSKVYVTRNQANAAPTPDPADFDEGDDLLIVNPTALAIVGRIPLGAYATPGPAGEVTQARPDHVLAAEGRVYVSLNSISGDFAATGAGRVAIIDPATDQVTGVIDLPGFKDCSGLAYVAATKRLYVACGGGYTDDPAAVLAASGLVEVDLGGAAPVIGRVVPASALGTTALNLLYPVIAGDAAFVGTQGALPNAATGSTGAPDEFFLAPLAGGSPVKLAEGGAFTLGTPAFDPTSGHVFLPDANPAAPIVHVYDAVTGAAAPAVDFEPNPSTHLPPRALAWY